MHYPNDPDRAFEAFVKTHLAAFGDVRQLPPTDKIEISASWLSALLTGPSLDELETVKHKGLGKGVTAGAVLLIAHLTEHLGRPIVFNTAAAVLETAATKRNGAARILGAIAKSNKASINSAWKEMRPAAHLWAATCIVEGGTTLAGAKRTPAHIIDILGLAATLGDWATTRLMGRGEQSDPVIDPRAIWQLPAWVKRLPIPHVEREDLLNWLVDTIENR